MSTNTNEQQVSNDAGKKKWEILVIDPRRCVGCEICESVCSYAHDKVFNPLNSRITRVRIEPIINNALNCLKCSEPDCVSACTLHAITQDPVTGIVRVDDRLCDGCADCLEACPYGVISMHTETNKALICDLCKDTEYDTPQCVEYCPKGAIFIEEIDPDQDKDRFETLKRLIDRGFEGEGMLN